MEDAKSGNNARRSAISDESLRAGGLEKRCFGRDVREDYVVFTCKGGIFVVSLESRVVGLQVDIILGIDLVDF